MILYGIDLPFTEHNNHPPQWPDVDKNGLTIDPGCTWYTCDKCDAKVHSFSPFGLFMLGDDHERKHRLELMDALEFHMRHCVPSGRSLAR